MSSPFDLVACCFSEEEEEVPSVPTSSIGIPPSELQGEKREWTVITRPDGTATMSTFDASKYVFYKQNPKQKFSLLVPKEKAPRYSGTAVVDGAYGKVIASTDPYHFIQELPIGSSLLIKHIFEDNGDVFFIAADDSYWRAPEFVFTWFCRMKDDKHPQKLGKSHKLAIYRKTEEDFYLTQWDGTKSLSYSQNFELTK